jgi:hypothetical protein
MGGGHMIDARTKEADVARQPGRDPYRPPRHFKPYSKPGFNHWDDITPPIFDDDETPSERKPRLLAAKFESSSREAEIFLHDPVSTLVNGTIEGITSVIEDSAQLPPDPYVATLVINHHRRLDWRVIRATAMVDDESIGITIHKEDGS